MFNRTKQDRLDELKRLNTLYELAIGQHERKIDQAKRGRLTFAQISTKTLFGLLYGDLRKLQEGKEQTIRDIESLEEELSKENDKSEESDDLIHSEQFKSTEELDKQDQSDSATQETCFLAVTEEQEGEEEETPAEVEEETTAEVVEEEEEGGDEEKDNIHTAGDSIGNDRDNNNVTLRPNNFGEADKDCDFRNNQISFDSNGIETPDITNDHLLDTLRVLDTIDTDDSTPFIL
jgi:hypothetical protein